MQKFNRDRNDSTLKKEIKPIVRKVNNVFDDEEEKKLERE